MRARTTVVKQAEIAESGGTSRCRVVGDELRVRTTKNIWTGVFFRIIPIISLHIPYSITITFISELLVWYILV